MSIVSSIFEVKVLKLKNIVRYLLVDNFISNKMFPFRTIRDFLPTHTQILMGAHQNNFSSSFQSHSSNNRIVSKFYKYTINHDLPLSISGTPT